MADVCAQHHLTPARHFHGNNNLVWLSCRNRTGKRCSSLVCLVLQKMSLERRVERRRIGSDGVSTVCLGMWQKA